MGILSERKEKIAGSLKNCFKNHIWLAICLCFMFLILFLGVFTLKAAFPSFLSQSCTESAGEEAEINTGDLEKIIEKIEYRDNIFSKVEEMEFKNIFD